MHGAHAACQAQTRMRGMHQSPGTTVVLSSKCLRKHSRVGLVGGTIMLGCSATSMSSCVLAALQPVCCVSHAVGDLCGFGAAAQHLAVLPVVCASVSGARIG
jgi:hypothetical protein